MGPDRVSTLYCETGALHEEYTTMRFRDKGASRRRRLNSLTLETPPRSPAFSFTAYVYDPKKHVLCSS